MGELLSNQERFPGRGRVERSGERPPQQEPESRDTHQRSIDTHLQDGLRIMHALGPDQKHYSFEAMEKSEQFQRTRNELNAWIKRIEPAEERIETAMTLLYRLQWATGSSYLHFDERTSTFSFRDREIDREHFNQELSQAVDSAIRDNPALLNAIRDASREWQQGRLENPNQLVQSLLTLVADVEKRCPSLSIDLPGWAGNYMGDFLDMYKQERSSQRNCVSESQITAQILTRLQALGYVPSSFQIVSYDREHHKEVTLHDTRGSGENHVGTKLTLGKDAQYFIDTWGTDAGERGQAHRSMMDWHKAFTDISDRERQWEQELKDALVLPVTERKHHPEHNVRWDFIALRFFAKRNAPLPIPLYSMFRYLKEMIVHYTAQDYREENALRNLYNTPRGWSTLRTHLATYFTTLYPTSRWVRETFASVPQPPEGTRETVSSENKLKYEAEWNRFHLETQYRLIKSDGQGSDTTIGKATERLSAQLDLLKLVKGGDITNFLKEIDTQLMKNGRLSPETKLKLMKLKEKLK